jgi:hypothetical protein
MQEMGVTSESSAVTQTQAQVEQANSLVPSSFGTQAWSKLQIPAAAFVPRCSDLAYDYVTSGYIAATADSGNCSGNVYAMWAPVQLPTGAKITWVDLWARDTDASNDIAAQLAQMKGGWTSVSPSLTFVGSEVSSSGSAGANYYVGLISPNYTVNNDVRYNGGAQLAVFIHWANTASMTSSLSFKAVDIWWQRQVSPAPASATFSDVPTTHQFFQYIEALADSGITSGCDASNYCPDDPLTRGQMAVFLSKALGLHWD